jgi:hypothetical protein
LPIEFSIFASITGLLVIKLYGSLVREEGGGEVGYYERQKAIRMGGGRRDVRAQ